MNFVISSSLTTTPPIDTIDVEFFEDRLLIMGVQFCRPRQYSCYKTAILILDKDFNVLNKLFHEGQFIRLINFKTEPKLIACIPTECSVYHWAENHFVNPFSLHMSFEAVDLVPKWNNVFFRGKDNGLYMFKEKNFPHVASTNLTDLFGTVQLHGLTTESNRMYLIVSSSNATVIRFQFFSIKNDTNVMVGANPIPKRDPFDEIEGCANRLQSQLTQSLRMITKINAILPKIKTTTGAAHFKKLTVRGDVLIRDSVRVKEIALKAGSESVRAEATLKQVEQIKNHTKELRRQTENLILIDREEPTARAIQSDSSSSSSASLLTANKIRVKNLKTRSPLFNNLVTKTGRNVIKGHLTVAKLIAPEVRVSSGVVNNVRLADLFLNDHPNPAPIRGLKRIRGLSANHVAINHTLNAVQVSHLNELGKDLANPERQRLRRVRARNVTVSRINGVSVDDFFASCYRSDPNHNMEIKGNLLMRRTKQPLKITNLYTRFLNGVPVTDYFTLKHDQVINRRVIFKNIFVPNLNASLINGIEFAKTVAIQGQNNLIESPVRIYSMKIDRKLILSNAETRETAQHIVGTRVEDLSQSYTGKVLIKGNLVLHNVTLENPMNFFLDDHKFPLDMLSEYWTRNTHQRFTKKVTLKGRIFTSQLLVNSINGHPSSSLITTDQEHLQTEGTVQFLDTIIERNVVKTGSDSEIVSISRNAVRKGQTTIIEGVKHFENITTKRLTSSLINGQQISHHFLTDNTILLCDRNITFDALYLDTELYSPAHLDLQIDRIDGINLHSMFTDTVYLNQPAELVSISIDQFEADGDLKVENLNGVNTTDALERLANLRFIANVTGQAKVERMSVENINGVHVRDYFDMLVRRDRMAPQELGGRKKFLRGFTVLGDLRVRNLSGVDVDNWMRNVLLWNENHEISEEWIFKSIQVGDTFDAKLINQMPTDLIIDAQSPLELHQDVHVNEMNIETGRLFARGAHNWTRVLHNLQNPLPRKWQRIEVAGDILMPVIDSKLSELITHGVNNRNAQTFKGQIKFRGLTRIKSLVTNNHTINSINLTHIMQDTLRNDAPKVQLVTGPVLFENGFQAAHLRASNLEVVHINQVNMIHLNYSLWRPLSKDPFPSIIIPKIIVDNLQINGTINGVFVNQLSTVDQVKLLQLEMRRNFSVQGNLVIDTINDLPFAYLINNRGKLNSKKRQRFTGSLTFDNLIIRGASSIQAINGVPIDSLLFSKSQLRQDVPGIKAFNQVYFLGPSTVNSINDVPFSDLAKSVVDKNRNQGLKRFNAETIVAEQGLQIRESLNDIPIQHLRSDYPTLPDLHQVMLQMKSILSKDLQSRRHERRFKYFDYSHNFDISPRLSGNESSASHLVLNRYTRSVCANKCNCNGQVEIQLSKFNEIRINSEKNVAFNGQLGPFHVQLSLNNSCNSSGEAFSVLKISRNGLANRIRIKGIATMIGRINTDEDESEIIFLTSAQHNNNATISIWRAEVPKEGDSSPLHLEKLRSFVFSQSKQSHAHLMRHNSNRLLIVSTLTKSPTKKPLTYLYLYAPEKFPQLIKVQHILRTYYDRFSSAATNNESYLAAAHSGLKSMDIFKVYVTSEGIHQLSSRTPIPFEAPVKDLLMFSAMNQLFVAALLDSAQLLIYRFNFIQVRHD